MNRSQRRLQQLKQTVSMKLAILEKQKEDIKDVLDDYSVQVVAKVDHLLGNELDLLKDPELCHEIIRGLDKASQVFTDVAINLDILLDAADNRPVSATTENEPLMSNKCVAQDKEHNEIISDISKPGMYETEISVQQNSNITASQLFEDGKERRQYQTSTQQAQFPDTNKHTQKENEEKQSGKREKQNHEQQVQLKDDICSGSLLNLPVDHVAAQEATKTTVPQSAHCSSDCGKAETTHSSHDSSLKSSLKYATSSLLPSEIISSSVLDGCSTTHHSDSACGSRIVSSPNDAAHQFQETCNISGHKWNSNSAMSEPLSVSVIPGNPMHVYSIPAEPSCQSSISPLISDHSGKMISVLMNAGSLPIATCISPGVISPPYSQLLEHSIRSHSLCNTGSIEQFVAHEPVCPDSWTASQQTSDNSVRLREPVSPLRRHAAQSCQLPIANTVSQSQQLNQMQKLCYPTLTSVIAELKEPTPFTSESSVPIPEMPGAASAVCNLSMSSSVKQQNLSNHNISASKSVLESDKENIECNRSQLPHFEQAQDTVTISPVIGKGSTAATTMKIVRGSLVTKNSQKYTLNDKNSTSSHQKLEATTSHRPGNLIRSIHMKRDVKRSSLSRNLNELMKEVEKAAHEKSRKLNKYAQLDKTSEVQVLQTEPIAPVAEASFSPSKTQESCLNVPYSKLQTTLSAGKSDNQENIQGKDSSEVSDMTITSLEPEKDSVFSAVVSTSIHPWSFHVQLVGLMQIISGLITHTVKAGNTASIIPHVGLFCLAKSNDQNYYRARVLSIEECPDGQTKSVKVVLIDYGIKKVVSLADVCSIPEPLMQYPCQAMFCALHKAGPKNSNCLWTEEVILEFQQCIKVGVVQVRVVYASPSEIQLLFPHIVDLMLTKPQTTHKGGNAIKSMADFLIEGDFAKDMQVEEYIAALWQMYSPDTHNASCRMKELKAVLSNEKVQPVTKTKLEVQQKLKVAHQPLRFKKGKAPKMNLSGDQATSNSSSTPSTSSYSGSVSDVVEVPQSRISPQADDKYELGNLVDEKLRSRCPSITSSHTHRKKVTERHVVEVSELSNYGGVSQPVFSQDGTEVEIKVMICKVISPNSFFIHIVDKDFIQKFQTLEEELLKLSTSLTKQPAWFNPAKNSLVCVTDSAQTNCYRGLVLDIKSDMQANLTDDGSSGHKFLIFFIDYGDFEWASRSRLFPLPSNFQNRAASVVWCTLEGVQPLQTATSSNGEGSAPLLWSRDVVDAFKSIVSEKQGFSVLLTKESFQQIIKSTSFQYEPVPVLLDTIVNGEEVCLNYELVSHNVASVRSSELDQSGNIPQWDPMAEEYTSIRNSYKVDTDEAGVALVGYKFLDMGQSLNMEGSDLIVFAEARMKEATDKDKAQRKERAAERAHKKSEADLRMKEAEEKMAKGREMAVHLREVKADKFRLEKKAEVEYAEKEKQIFLENEKVDAEVLLPAETAKLHSHLEVAKWDRQPVKSVAYLEVDNAFKQLNDQDYFDRPDIPILMCDENLSLYLDKFQRTMTVKNIPEDQWIYHLGSLLTGSALETFSRLKLEDIVSFTTVRQQLLAPQKYAEEKCIRKYKATAPPMATSFQAFVTDLESSFYHWINSAGVENSFHRLVNLMLHDKILSTCEDLFSIFQEKKSQSVDEMVSLVKDYLSAQHDLSCKDKDTPRVTSDIHQSHSSPKDSCRRSNGYWNRYQNNNKTRQPENAFQNNNQSKQYYSRPKGCAYSISWRRDSNYCRARCNGNNNNDKECFICHSMKWKSGLVDCPICIHPHLTGRCPRKIQSEENVTPLVGGMETPKTMCDQIPMQGNSSQLIEIEDRNSDTYTDPVQVMGQPEIINTVLFAMPTKYGLPIHFGYIGKRRCTVLHDTEATVIGVTKDVVPSYAFTGKFTCIRTDNGALQKCPLAILNIHTPFYWRRSEVVVVPRLAADIVIGSIEGAKDCTPEEIAEWYRKYDRVEHEKTIVTQPCNTSNVQRWGYPSSADTHKYVYQNDRTNRGNYNKHGKMDRGYNRGRRYNNVSLGRDTYNRTVWSHRRHNPPQVCCVGYRGSFNQERGQRSCFR